MKLGKLEAKRGEKVFGHFTTGETHGRFPVHIPLHIVEGASEGPTLVVQAGTSGLEIEPSLILPHVVKEIDPAQVSGTLIMVPLMNTSGFEFTQIKSVFDDKHLNQVGRGKADGSISEQMIHQYYEAAIAKADALLDIRTGSQWSYHHFAGVIEEGDVDRSKALAISLGLPQVVLGNDEYDSMALAAARDGKAVVVAFIGGGPGLRDYRDRDLGTDAQCGTERNAPPGHVGGRACFRCGLGRRHKGTFRHHADGCPRIHIHGHAPARQTGQRRRQIGLRAPSFFGETLEEIRAPRAGIVVDCGASWPVAPEGEILAIVGDLVEELAIG